MTWPSVQTNLLDMVIAANLTFLLKSCHVIRVSCHLSQFNIHTETSSLLMLRMSFNSSSCSSRNIQTFFAILQSVCIETRSTYLSDRKNTLSIFLPRHLKSIDILILTAMMTFFLKCVLRPDPAIAPSDFRYRSKSHPRISFRESSNPCDKTHRYVHALLISRSLGDSSISSYFHFFLYDQLRMFWISGAAGSPGRVCRTYPHRLH